MADDDFNSAIRELADDRVHGAAELARHALEIAAQSARTAAAVNGEELRRTLCARAEALAAARPSMAPISNLLGRWQAALAAMPEDDPAAMRDAAAAAAHALAAQSRHAATEAAARAAAFFGAGRTLMTHSLSSTVVDVFYRLREAKLRVIATESRPLFEGRELAARLSAWSVPTVLITDAEMGLFVARADAVLVGADSLCADASLVNKAGTYLLALAARDQGVPFHVCCESFKRCPAGAPPPEMEAMDPAELGAPPQPHVTPANVYFDVTPARLISGWFTEMGGPAREDALGGPVP